MKINVRMVIIKFRTVVPSGEEGRGCDEEDTQKTSGEFDMLYFSKLGKSQILIILLSVHFLFAHLPSFIIIQNSHSYYSTSQTVLFSSLSSPTMLLIRGCFISLHFHCSTL